MNPDWLIPQWSAPASVRALCTSRAGGVSAGVYASLNLGDHVGDTAAAVAANRMRLGRALGVRPVFLQQVHGTQVALLDRSTPDGRVADGCVSAQRDLACTILVADCLPVLMTTGSGTVVAAAHAGWRGLAAGVLEATLQRLWRHAGSADPGAMARDTRVWLGPCIGPQAFVVGPEVRAAFVAQQPQASQCFAPHGHGKFLADLAGLARQRLDAQGIGHIHGNDGGTQWCSASRPSSFFSHRRDGVSGRMAACIWL
ncbi:MAG: peptidoglycan editing factor PgeF, partial [Betaproteobacteria bacterium]